MSAPPPKQLGRYEIEREIGRGMMGVVYRAQDPALRRVVALKTVSIPGAISPEQKESFEQRFLAEARAAAALSHPAIVVVHDVGRDKEAGTPYIALEYLDGRTIAEILEADGALPLARALPLAARLADALHHAHERGVVHRDIKPANIMVTPSGEPKIMDFGIARLPASTLTAAGELFGTPSYMSPEQALNQAVDGRSDLFSLGLVLYAMITGERAFSADSVPQILTLIAYKDAPPPSSKVAGVSADVDAVLARVLAKDPTRRYPDGRTLAEDLDDVARGLSPRHRSQESPRPVADGTVASGLRLPPKARIANPPPLDFGEPPPSSPLANATPASARLRKPHLALILGGALTAFLVLAVLVLVPFLRFLQVRGVPLPLGPARVPLEVTINHSLKEGTARVFIDDDEAFAESLESRVTQKILAVEIRRGALKKTVYVPLGEHTIKVQVQGDSFTVSRRITGTFAALKPRRLQAEVGGLLKKDLELVWTD